MGPLLFLISLLLAGSHGNVATVTDLAVLEGRSVTIPCHYEVQYARHVKYWCRGPVRSFCFSLARTDTAPTAESRVSISDDPAQQVFTVTLSDLKEGDSGWYWCGVEVGGIWSTDDAMSIHITVSHGISVVNSMVAGEEGGSISVQCLYGSRYGGSSKKWCRAGYWGSCLEVPSNSTLETGAVLLSDDGAGVFTVTVQPLELANAGWYWCTVEQEQVSVHIAVSPRSSTQRAETTSQPPLMTSRPVDLKEASTSLATSSVHKASQGQNSLSHVLGSPLMIGGLLLLLVIVAMVPWRMWYHYQRMQRRRGVGGTELCLTPHPVSENGQNKGGVIFFSSSSPQQVHLI